MRSKEASPTKFVLDLSGAVTWAWEGLRAVDYVCIGPNGDNREGGRVEYGSHFPALTDSVANSDRNRGTNGKPKFRSRDHESRIHFGIESGSMLMHTTMST